MKCFRKKNSVELVVFNRNSQKVKGHLRKTAVIIICAAFLFVVWLVSFIRINAAFPSPDTEAYAKNEKLRVEDLDIKLYKCDICADSDDVISRLTDEDTILRIKKGRSDYRYIYTELKICNSSGEVRNITGITQDWVIECMPSGWSNRAVSECGQWRLAAGESTVVKLVYTLNIPENADIDKEEFHLVYRTYPKKIMFVLDI